MTIPIPVELLFNLLLKKEVKRKIFFNFQVRIKIIDLHYYHLVTVIPLNSFREVGKCLKKKVMFVVFAFGRVKMFLICTEPTTM